MSDEEKETQLDPADDNKVLNKFFLYPALVIFSVRCLWSFALFLKTGSFESISMLSFLEDHFPKEYSKLYDASDWVGLKMIFKFLFTVTTPEMFWVLIGAGLDSSVEKSTGDDIDEDEDEDDQTDESIDENSESDNFEKAEPAFIKSVKQNASIYVEKGDFTLGNKVRVSSSDKTDEEFKRSEVNNYKEPRVDLSVLQGEPFIDESGVQIVDIKKYIMTEGPVLYIKDTTTNEFGQFNFNKDIVIGNTKDCDIQWSGIDKGKLVCKLTHKNGRVTLSTCDHTVVLNGEKFSGKCVIENNSVIKLSKFEFTYSASESQKKVS